MTDEPYTLVKYEADAKEDDNAFWRLDSGVHLNLLEEAIEQRNRLRFLLYQVLYTMHPTGGSTNPGGVGGQGLTTFCHIVNSFGLTEEQIGHLTEACDEALSWSPE